MNLETLLSTFAAEEEGDGWIAVCPAHADSKPSLRVAVGRSAVILKCRAGCATDAVLSALGLTYADLPDVSTVGPIARRARSTSAPAGIADVAALAARLDAYAVAASPSGGEDAARVYAYNRFGLSPSAFVALGLGLARDLGGGARLVVPFRDAAGVPRGFQARALESRAAVRWLGPKSPDGASWSKVAVMPGANGWEEVVVTEGPGDGLTSVAVGYDTIAVRGAALATNPEVLASIVAFAGERPVIVVGDADAAGDKFARDLAAGIARLGASVRKVRPPLDGDDLTDWRERDPERFATEFVRAVGEAVDPGGLATRLDAWPDPAQTELAQAGRLRDRIGNAGSGVRFTPETGFYLLDSGVWRPDGTDAVRTFAQDAAWAVWAEAEELLSLAQERVDVLSAIPPASITPAETIALAEAKRNVKRAGSVKAFARGANSSRGIDAVVRELKALRGVAASLLDFDRHPHLLAVRNGVVDLRRGVLLDADPALLLTRRIDVDFDPAASAPRWDRFLEEVFPAHADMPAYLRRLIGYGVTGETSEQCFAVLYGTGANGKSVFTDTLTEVFREITTTTPFSTFEIRPNGGIPNDLAALKGARLVMASEGEQGRPMAESVLKRVTGRDMISARFMRQEFFEFRPTFLLMLASNSKPSFRGQDEGLWRRVKLLPWERYFLPAERDHRLGDALLAERDGIFAWAVRGAVEWYRGGLADPAIVQAETKQYRETSDALAGFLPGHFVKETGATTTLAVLWDEYLRWADSEALPQRERWTRKTFAGALEERGLEKRKRANGVVYVGVRKARITDAVEDHDVPEDDDRATGDPLAVSSSAKHSPGADLSAIY